MILTCNSCSKKFVVPDSAISASGRTVQCGSCGNKWKQFPVKQTKKASPIYQNQRITSQTQKIQPKKPKPKKSKKSTVKKPREINLYSPEYLAKKHGIKLKDEVDKTLTNTNVSFGFYNFFILFLVIIIILSRTLYFFQDIIVQKLPFTEFDINYFFESIRNMFEIWKNLIANY